MSKVAKVAIIGFGGIGGHCVRTLSKYNVTVINPVAAMIKSSAGPSGFLLSEGGRRSGAAPVKLQPKALRNATFINGAATAVDKKKKTIEVRLLDGKTQTVDYDILVIITGTRSGSIKDVRVQSYKSWAKTQQQYEKDVANANKVAIVGAGLSGVDAALTIARQNPKTKVELFASKDILPAYPDGFRNSVEKILAEHNVKIHKNIRIDLSQKTDEFKSWDKLKSALKSESGEEFESDVVIWTVGGAKPNTEFLPKEWLDEQNYVNCNDKLQVKGETHVFALGDVAHVDGKRPDDPLNPPSKHFEHIPAAVDAVLNGKEPAPYKPVDDLKNIIFYNQDKMFFKSFKANGKKVPIPTVVVTLFNRMMFGKTPKQAEVQTYLDSLPDDEPAPFAFFETNSTKSKSKKSESLTNDNDDDADDDIHRKSSKKSSKSSSSSSSSRRKSKSKSEK